MTEENRYYVLYKDDGTIIHLGRQPQSGTEAMITDFTVEHGSCNVIWDVHATLAHRVDVNVNPHVLYEP